MSVFYSFMLAIFSALAPGGAIREGHPPLSPPVPALHPRLRAFLVPLIAFTSAAIASEFAAQLVHLYLPLNWKPVQGLIAALDLFLWGAACYLANQAAWRQPAKNFWKIALGDCPEQVKMLLAVQAALSVGLAFQSGEQGLLIAPVQQLSLAIFFSRSRAVVMTNHTK